MITRAMTTAAASLLLALAACGNSDNSGIRVTANLLVNGAGVSGSVQEGTERFYVLQDLVAGNTYTLRTSIATDGGTLTMDVHRSEATYENAEPALVSAAPASRDPSVYEASFVAQETGDYLISITGEPGQAIAYQYFYDLRLFSSNALASFTTTTIPAAATALIEAGTVKIYSGAAVTPAGTYAVSLTSKATSTLGNPQVFVFSDGSLTIDKLLYSSYSTTTAFMITTFSTGTTPSPSEVNAIPGVVFSGSGPFIMLKGSTTVEYTLTVGP